MRAELEGRRRKSLARIAVACGGAALALAGATGPARAQQAAPDNGVSAATQGGETEDQKLAKQLANPVASLISVPFQFNYDQGLNWLSTGERLTLNIQPVVPFSLNADWNLISRTILPVTWTNDALVDSGRIFGTGDTLQSFFLVPVKTWNGITWGVGPILMLPTGSSDIYSVHQWGAGPTGVALKQTGPWTVGALVNHVWSFASTGYPNQEVNFTFVQPFLSYTTADAWSFTLNSESTYDWHAKTWQVPINAIVSKVVKIGSQRVSFAVGARYYAASPDPAAKGWGARFAVTFLFPK